jgi:circadian clock protein KaiC
MRVSTGIKGLDHILCGGLLPGRTYLVHGHPGTGKTTLGLHFLAAGEGGLLIAFGQSAEHIRADANSFGINIDKVRILDLSPPAEMFSEVRAYDIFWTAEVEREPISQEITTAVAELRPSRIFVDGFGYFRSFVSDKFHYRRLAQSFFRFATRDGATLLIGSEDRMSARDADGVIQLEFSTEGRSIAVSKFRGSDFIAGRHPMRLSGRGLETFPTAA